MAIDVTRRSDQEMDKEIGFLYPKRATNLTDMHFVSFCRIQSHCSFHDPGYNAQKAESDMVYTFEFLISEPQSSKQGLEP